MAAPARSQSLPQPTGKEVAPFWGKGIGHEYRTWFGGGSGEEYSKGTDDILMPSLIFGGGGGDWAALGSPAVCCDNSKW